MIGKELSNLTTNHFGDDMAFVPPKIIGITPWGCVAGRNKFVDVVSAEFVCFHILRSFETRMMDQSNSFIVFFSLKDHRYKEVSYKNVKGTSDGKRVPLLPFNSAFIFGDDGFRGNYDSFAKSQFRAMFEKKIASAKNGKKMRTHNTDGFSIACSFLEHHTFATQIKYNVY